MTGSSVLRNVQVLHYVGKVWNENHDWTRKRQNLFGSIFSRLPIWVYVEPMLCMTCMSVIRGCLQSAPCSSWPAYNYCIALIMLSDQNKTKTKKQKKYKISKRSDSYKFYNDVWCYVLSVHCCLIGQPTKTFNSEAKYLQI